MAKDDKHPHKPKLSKQPSARSHRSKCQFSAFLPKEEEEGSKRAHLKKEKSFKKKKWKHIARRVLVTKDAIHALGSKGSLPTVVCLATDSHGVSILQFDEEEEVEGDAIKEFPWADIDGFKHKEYTNRDDTFSFEVKWVGMYSFKCICFESGVQPFSALFKTFDRHIEINLHPERKEKKALKKSKSSKKMANEITNNKACARAIQIPSDSPSVTAAASECSHSPEDKLAAKPLLEGAMKNLQEKANQEAVKQAKAEEEARKNAEDKAAAKAKNEAEEKAKKKKAEDKAAEYQVAKQAAKAVEDKYQVAAKAAKAVEDKRLAKETAKKEAEEKAKKDAEELATKEAEDKLTARRKRKEAHDQAKKKEVEEQAKKAQEEALEKAKKKEAYDQSIKNAQEQAKKEAKGQMWMEKEPVAEQHADEDHLLGPSIGLVLEKVGLCGEQPAGAVCSVCGELEDMHTDEQFEACFDAESKRLIESNPACRVVSF
jgi:hypothetical protein